MIPATWRWWTLSLAALATTVRQTAGPAGVPTDGQIVQSAAASPGVLSVVAPALASVITALATVWLTSRQRREETVSQSEQARWTELRQDYRESKKSEHHYRTRYLVEKEQHGVTKVELTRAQMEIVHLRRLLEGEDDHGGAEPDRVGR